MGELENSARNPRGLDGKLAHSDSQKSLTYSLSNLFFLGVRRRMEMRSKMKMMMMLWEPVGYKTE
jgi:hypothetical protein